VGAIAKQLDSVRCDGKVVLFPDAFLQISDFIIGKLYDPAATIAPQVRMILMTINVFIVEMAVLKIDLFDEAAFDEEGNGPVEGGLGYPFSLIS
jgi:hypothetical protein